MDTGITQVAIFLTSVAYYRVFIEGSDILPDSYAGHSVGEYAALVCSGAMRFEDGLSLIRRRGQLMQKVSDDMGDGGMLAIMGMAYPEVEELTEAAKTFFIGQRPWLGAEAAPHYGKAGRRNLGPTGNNRWMILLDMRG